MGMITRHFMDGAGFYVGAYGDGAIPPDGLIECAEPPHGLARWRDGVWVVSLPVPASMSFAQLLIGLVKEAWITEAEGEAWLVGTLPVAVSGLISTLPQEQQFPAKARAIRPSVVYRLDPLVQALGMAEGKTEAELDEFFIKYGVK